MSLITSSVIYGTNLNDRGASIVTGKIEEIKGVKYPIVSVTQDQNGRPRKNKILSFDSGYSLSKSMLTQFLRTDKGQRVMRPNFGLNLKQYLFENMDVTLFSDISSELLKDIRNYFTNIYVKEISVFVPNKNMDYQSLNVRMVIEDIRLGKSKFLMEVGIKWAF